MMSKIIDGIRLIRVPENLEYEKAIFQEPPEDLDESWTHGALVGGLVWLSHQADIARSYSCAADTLIEKAVEERLSWEVVYPVIFLYRHAVEIALKALFPGVPHNHQLNKLIDQADVRIRAVLPTHEADWVKARLLEFVEVDPRSTAFRFAGAKVDGVIRSDGEWWIDFPHLRQTMKIILPLLEVIAWGDPSSEAER